MHVSTASLNLLHAFWIEIIAYVCMCSINSLYITETVCVHACVLSVLGCCRVGSVLCVCITGHWTVLVTAVRETSELSKQLCTAGWRQSNASRLWHSTVIALLTWRQRRVTLQEWQLMLMNCKVLGSWDYWVHFSYVFLITFAIIKCNYKYTNN